MASQQNRILWIDCLKGIAILLVVIGHNANETIGRFIYCFHMPLFFLLSGFLFSPKPYTQHLVKSSKRLLLPYVFFVALISLPFLCNYLIKNDLTGGGKLLLRLIYGGRFLVGEYGVLWFITVLWCSQNLFNILVQNKLREYWIPILIFVGYLSQLLPNVLPWDIQVVPIATVYIWIGYLVKQYVYPKLNLRNLNVLLITSIAILLTIFLLRDFLALDMKFNIFPYYGVSLISATISSMAVAIISIYISKFNLLSKIFGYLGLASMVIMYIHQSVKCILFTRIGMVEYHLAVIISAIIISLAVYELFKRFSFTRKMI
ncbi:MAG: acyltransferase family protein [Muribaculum sp.]|nr:acyltransferase family protein [Muribaculum sp.]